MWKIRFSSRKLLKIIHKDMWPSCSKRCFCTRKWLCCKTVILRQYLYFATIIFILQKTNELGNLFLCRIFTQDKKLIKCLMDIITDFVWCHVTKWRGGSCGGSNYTALSLHSGLKSEKYCNKKNREKNLQKIAI